jgi:four helix bundle protein
MVNENLKVKSQNQILKVKTDLNKRCFNYSIKIIQFIRGLPKERIYWVLSDQLVRSATSIGANIFEAKSASSKRDFIKYYEIALKSANESTY